MTVAAPSSTHGGCVSNRAPASGMCHRGDQYLTGYCGATHFGNRMNVIATMLGYAPYRYNR